MGPRQALADADIYKRHALELIRYATSLVGPDDASDVVTDAVVAAFSSPGWPSVVQPRAYLYRAVYFRAIEVHRSTTRRRRREQAVAPRDDNPSIDPSGTIDAFRSLAKLSAQQRAVVYLTYWEDQPPVAIAELLNVSEGTVRKQLARARDQLRRELS